MDDDEEFGLCKIMWRLRSQEKFSADMVGSLEKLCACVGSVSWWVARPKLYIL